VNQAGFNTSTAFGAAAGSAAYDEILAELKLRQLRVCLLSEVIFIIEV
jgi:hypothetical protein